MFRAGRPTAFCIFVVVGVALGSGCATTAPQREEAITSEGGNLIAVPTGDPTRPSDLLVSVLLPASSSDLRSTQPLERSDERLRADAVEKCMAERGFSLSFHGSVPPDWVPRVFHFPDLESIRTHGFVEPREATSEGDRLVAAASDGLGGEEGGGGAPAAALPEGLTAGEAEALVQSHAACSARADTTTSPLQAFKERHDSLYTQWMEGVLSLDRSDAIVVAQERWVACIRDQGWDVDSEDRFFAELDARRLASSDAEASASVDRSARQPYITCTRALENVRRPLREDARDTFVDRNFAGLMEAEFAFRQVLEALSE